MPVDHALEPAPSHTFFAFSAAPYFLMTITFYIISGIALLLKKKNLAPYSCAWSPWASDSRLPFKKSHPCHSSLTHLPALTELLSPSLVEPFGKLRWSLHLLPPAASCCLPCFPHSAWQTPTHSSNSAHVSPPLRSAVLPQAGACACVLPPAFPQHLEQSFLLTLSP